MTTFVGLVLNLIGTLIVSVSASNYMGCVNASLLAQELTIQAYFSRSQIVPVFEGLEQNREKELRKSSRWVRAGLWLITAGFVVQVIPLFPVFKK